MKNKQKINIITKNLISGLIFGLIAGFDEIKELEAIEATEKEERS